MFRLVPNDLMRPSRASLLQRPRARGPEFWFATVLTRLTAIVFIVAAKAGDGFQAVLTALHESRRQEAIRVLARYRHLVCDDPTSAAIAAWHPPIGGRGAPNSSSR